MATHTVQVQGTNMSRVYMYRLQYWALSLLVFPALTLFGNMLVCLSVYIERTLHTVTNYFIVSLAVADIMVAILVMPLAVYVEVRLMSHLHQIHVARIQVSRTSNLYPDTSGYMSP